LQTLVASLLVALMPTTVQDVGFRMLLPAAHAHVSAHVPDRVEDSWALNHVMTSTRHLLEIAGVDGEVNGRVKSLLSTHQKMQRKGIGLEDVRDRIALRIYVDSVADCYVAMDLLHTRFDPTGHATDYIANPKDNGYQSLHTTVEADGSIVEFQVRTHEMHEHAEGGSAAHWRYKLTA
jgi:GTP pyrophosphokinase